VDLEAYELVLLRRPENAPDLPEETLDRSLRGLTFYRTGSVAEAQRLAEDDPAVRAGRLIAEIMTWYCRPGTMTKPGRPVSVP
jgi:hypothetical protein